MKPINKILFRLGCAAAVMLTVAGSARADYPSTVLTQGPSGYWRLNETSIPVFYSAAANSGSLGSTGNAKYIGSPTRGLSGPFAGTSSVGLSGSGQWVTNAWSSSANTSNFTFEAWVKPAQVPFTSASVAYVASSVHIASPRSGWYLGQDNGATFLNGSAFTFRMFNQNSTTASISLSVPVTNAGAWYHLVITYDGTTVKFYENGAVLASGTPTSYLGNKFVPNVDAPLSIGCRSDTGFPWPGQASEVAVYSIALSATQVLNHYNTGNTTPASYISTVQADAPVLYYHFTEPSDVIVTAANSGSLGSSVKGTYQPGTVPGAVGPQPPTFSGFESTNSSVTFNGNGSSISLPALNLNTNTVTICGWVKANGTQKTAAGILVQDTATTYAGLTIDAVNGGLGLGYVWNDNDANTYNWSPSGDSHLPTLNDSEWDFVALVVQPTEANIYICSPTIPFTGVTNYLAHSAEKFNGTTLIGSDSGLAAYSFNGNIDEVAVWNRSLSAGELFSQYASAVGGQKPQIFGDLQTPTLFVGDTLNLTVDVGGTPPLYYQWYNSGGAIAGATNKAYIKANAQASDNDTYYAVVTNNFGTVTSASATVNLTPTYPPTIDVQPAGTTLYPGGTLNLSVVAEGGGLKYQWKKGGAAIAGATAANYTLPSVTTNSGGVYSVLITNNSGSITGGPVTVTVVVPAANSYEAAIVADAPEAWYRLNESAGATVLHDSMGRHDGFYTNFTGGSLPSLGASGAIAGSSDTAVTFDGTSVAFGQVPYADALNSQQFAIEAWVKTTDTISYPQMAVSSHSGTFKGYGLQQYPAGKWAGEVSQNGANYYVSSATAAAGVVAGQWAHLVLTYGTNTGLRVYVNGQWDGSSYVDFQRNSDSPLIIGGFGPLPISRLFDGQVDEVAVYANTMTLAQAQNHYSKGRFATPIPPYFVLQPQSNQVVSNSAANYTLTGQADGPLPITYQWYKNGIAVAGATNATLSLSETYSNGGAYVLRAINGNGNTNSTAAAFAVLPPTPAYVNVTNGLVLHLTFDGNYQDSSGRGNNGTPTGFNATPSISAGRIGSGAVHYETDNDTGQPGNIGTPTVTSSSFVTLGAPADLQFSSNVDFSVSYWVKLPAGYLNGDLPFLCNATNSTHNTGVTFAPGYTNGSYGFSYNGLSLNGPANAINDGNWHHLLHSVNRSGYAYTYVDGNQVDAQIATTIGDLSSTAPYNIGQDPTGLYTEQGSADVDDVAVWRRALTAYEAYSIYYAATNSNSSFNVPGTVNLGISTVGNSTVISWNPGSALGTLLQSTNVTGPWTPVGTYAPYYQVPFTGSQMFYRLSTPE